MNCTRALGWQTNLGNRLGCKSHFPQTEPTHLEPSWRMSRRLCRNRVYIIGVPPRNWYQHVFAIWLDDACVIQRAGTDTENLAVVSGSSTASPMKH